MASLEELRKVRISKLEILKKAGMNPYPARVPHDFSLKEVREKFSDLEKKYGEKASEKVSLSGRIMAIRGQGAIFFVVLDDGTEKFQAVFKKDVIDEKLMALFAEAVDLGDFISVTGSLFITQRGEQSILVNSWTIATKAILPLPEKFHGIQDEDEKLRKRYLEFLMSAEARDLFYKRAKFWETIRNFMKGEGFLEVDTPTLEVTTGGAEARPFKTHHNDLDLDVYLRISMGELWQKRLIAGGFPKTFEIGRVYRNEGSSPDHLQEFTNMEFYWAYSDYIEGMKLTERMIKKVAEDVFGTMKFKTRGYEFDLGGEWPKMDYVATVEKMTGVNVLTASTDEMKKKLDDLKVKYEGENKERLTDTLWKYCRKQIAGPAWLINHPKIVSPLSKAKEENTDLTERYQLILAGSELANGFSELNDPIDQRTRFELQQKLIERGDDEAMMPEWDFVEMLEHGMPPTSGLGIGDRLFAYLADKTARETQMFPLVRPKEEGKNAEKAEKKGKK